MDPLQVIGYTCVYAVVTWAGASFAPAHNAQEKCGVPVRGDERSTAVPLTRVLFTLEVASTEHVQG